MSSEDYEIYREPFWRRFRNTIESFQGIKLLLLWELGNIHESKLHNIKIYRYYGEDHESLQMVG